MSAKHPSCRVAMVPGLRRFTVPQCVCYLQRSELLADILVGDVLLVGFLKQGRVASHRAGGVTCKWLPEHPGYV